MVNKGFFDIFFTICIRFYCYSSKSCILPRIWLLQPKMLQRGLGQQEKDENHGTSIGSGNISEKGHEMS